MVVSNNVYVIDSYLPHNKNGLICTLEKLVEIGFIIPDPSLLPVVSVVDKKKLTSEKISYVIETINALGHLLSSQRTFTPLKTKKALEKMAKEEVSYSEKNDLGSLPETYDKFIGKLNTLNIWEGTSKENEDKFSIIFNAIKFIEKALDLRKDGQIDFDDYINNLAFASLLAVTVPNLNFTIASVDKNYQVLFDAFFGIPYKMLSAKDGNKKENRIARSIKNPRLSLTSCDLEQANQPFIIERDLYERLKIPSEFYKLPEEKKKEILTELIKYFSNLSLALNGNNLFGVPS